MSRLVLDSVRGNLPTSKALGAHRLTWRIKTYAKKPEHGTAIQRNPADTPARSARNDRARSNINLSTHSCRHLSKAGSTQPVNSAKRPDRLPAFRDKRLDQSASRYAGQEQQPPRLVASHANRRYGSSVAANSAAGRRNPITSRRNSAQITTAGVFFRLRFSVMAAVCGQASAWPGAYCPGIPTPHTAATQSRRKDGGGSIKVGATPMKHALNPSASHAAAWKARALAALRADSSLSVRLARYNSAMARARALEAQAVAHV